MTRYFAIGACLTAAALAQPVPRFEVASVKPSSPAQIQSGNSGGHSGNGRVVMTNVTLKRLIMGAYGIGPNQVAGGPAWLDGDRFEVNAKSENPKDGDSNMMPMLQSLLAERFKLKMHRESRPMPVYVLELARNGLKLEKAEGGESSTNNGRGDLVLKNSTMTSFAEKLSRQMDLPVVDRTGLEGIFNLELKWDTESSKPASPGVERGPSVFTAIQEQLGLRLRSEKAPTDVLVIDSAEHPSEN